jgi:hypothetical protein
LRSLLDRGGELERSQSADHGVDDDDIVGRAARDGLREFDLSSRTA